MLNGPRISNYMPADAIAEAAEALAKPEEGIVSSHALSLLAAPCGFTEPLGILSINRKALDASANRQLVPIKIGEQTLPLATSSLLALPRAAAERCQPPSRCVGDRTIVADGRELPR
jgi:hypothetical protein